MAKFKRGDKVSRANGKPFSNGSMVATVGDVRGDSVYFQETLTYLCDYELRLAHSNPPRPHAEIIKAWADGAEVECKKSGSKQWEPVLGNPYWCEELLYRIKPEKSEAEIEKEQILQQIEELKERLESLEVK